jgi:predicted ATPase
MPSRPWVRKRRHTPSPNAHPTRLWLSRFGSSGAPAGHGPTSSSEPRACFIASTYLEQLGPDALRAYGGKSLHEQSHGEGFLALMIHRFGPDGFYLLDEPEAALSTQNCSTCLRRIHELVQAGSQFVISTHSPIILAYPDATIYRCTASGLEHTAYDDAEPVRLTTSFLAARQRFLHELFSD